MNTPQGRKVIKDGRAYYKVGDAAKLLGTNAAKVKALMGSGQLEWMQLRAGSKTMLISAESIVKCKYPGTVILKSN